jgi:PKHD-type hydroxylase
MNYFFDENQEHAFFIRSKLSKETTEAAIKDLELAYNPENRLDTASVTGGVNENLRKTKVCEIPTSFWLCLVMQSALREANDRFFKFDLTSWANHVQYLRYDAGDHYNSWHIDMTASPLNKKDIRKLSVLVALSDPDDYEGGEFQYYLPGTTRTFKLEQGEIVVFPSTLHHRVRRIKSGTRRTMIGWYGGPPFK